uniref:[acyl-carrier-protein] S-malonyltransferase n=1 Tax=Blastobotrys adeninivorans TaxID=409370 RepID=A0A060T7R4_BLAAD
MRATRLVRFASTVSRSKSAIAFPGQGTQKPGLLKEFLTSHRQIVDPILKETDEALGENLSQALVDEHTKYDVNETRNTQPILVAYGYTMFQVVKHELEKQGLPLPEYCLGHSLGEYSAYASSGLLSYSTAIELVRKRAVAMSEATSAYPAPTSMVAVLTLGHDAAALRDIVAGIPNCSLAIINGPSQMVLSGDSRSIRLALDRITTSLKLKRPFRTKALQVSGPFHSPIMAPARKYMESIVDDYKLNWPPSMGIVSNISGKLFSDEQEVYHSIINTPVEPVLWAPSISFLPTLGVDKIYSIGSTSFVKSALSKGEATEVVQIDGPSTLSL